VAHQGAAVFACLMMLCKRVLASYLQVRSSFYFICGLLAWLVVRAIAASPVTLVTGGCELCACRFL
jgi:hypothetical protein